MRDFIVPRDAQPSLVEAFRQARLMIKDNQIPLLHKMASVRAIQEQTSCFHFEDQVLCLYTKVNGKLHRFCYGEGVEAEEVEAKETREYLGKLE